MSVFEIFNDRGSYTFALMKFLLPSLFLASFCMGQKEIKKADLIIYNARIISGPYTSNYSSMIVKDGKIEGLYKNNSWRKEYTSDKILDLDRMVIIPGFIDAHCHFLGLGKSMEEVSLWGCKSWEETVNRVVNFVKFHPELLWIQGRGWDQNNWRIGRAHV